MELEPYKTSDTPFAAFLWLKGMEILGTVDDVSDPERKVYVFIDTPERPGYEQEFRNSEFREYWKALKAVRRYLNKGV